MLEKLEDEVRQEVKNLELRILALEPKAFAYLAGRIGLRSESDGVQVVSALLIGCFLGFIIGCVVHL